MGNCLTLGVGNYLAFDIGKGEYPEALRWLLLGAQMEPQRPAFLMEAGNAYGHCGDHPGALNCF